MEDRDGQPVVHAVEQGLTNKCVLLIINFAGWQCSVPTLDLTCVVMFVCCTRYRPTHHRRAVTLGYGVRFSSLMGNQRMTWPHVSFFPADPFRGTHCIISHERVTHCLPLHHHHQHTLHGRVGDAEHLICAHTFISKYVRRANTGT